MDDEPTLQQLHQIRARLDEVAAELRVLLSDEAGLAGTVTLDQAAMGRVSRADALQAQQMAKAAHRRAESRLGRVLAAMERFDDDPDAYAWCPECGESVGTRRLLAVPESIFCVRCLEARGR